jgi:hypothetical protein
MYFQLDSVVMHIFAVNEKRDEARLSSPAEALMISAPFTLLGGEHNSGTSGVIVALECWSNSSEVVVVCYLKHVPCLLLSPSPCDPPPRGSYCLEGRKYEKQPFIQYFWTSNME